MNHDDEIKKVCEMLEKEMKVPVDKMRKIFNLREHRVGIYSANEDLGTTTLLGNFMWSEDCKQFIAIKYALKSSGRGDRGEEFWTKQEAIDTMRKHCNAGLLGSSTYTIQEVYTTAGMPY